MKKEDITYLLRIIEKKIKLYKSAQDVSLRNYIMGQIDGIGLIVLKHADLEDSIKLLDLEKDLRVELNNGHREEKWE